MVHTLSAAVSTYPHKFRHAPTGCPPLRLPTQLFFASSCPCVLPCLPRRYTTVFAFLMDRLLPASLCGSHALSPRPSPSSSCLAPADLNLSHCAHITVQSFLHLNTSYSIQLEQRTFWLGHHRCPSCDSDCQCISRISNHSSTPDWQFCTYQNHRGGQDKARFT